MGKTGDLIRKQKKQSAMYTFTGEQLEAHDMAVRAAYRKDLWGRMKTDAQAYAAEQEKELRAKTHEYWDSVAKEFYGPDKNENFENLLSYLLAIPSRVLIERFGWKPVPKDGNYDKRRRIVQFAIAVEEELEKISKDNLMDIRTYCDETFELYGVRYNRMEEE